MSSFRKAVTEFRAAVREAGEQYASPGLHDILERERSARRVRWQWAAAGVMMLALAAIPLYRQAQREQPADEARADALMLERVNVGLARSAPRAMAALAYGSPAKVAKERD